MELMSSAACVYSYRVSSDWLDFPFCRGHSLDETPVDVEEQELPGVNPFIASPPRQPRLDHRPYGLPGTCLAWGARARGSGRTRSRLGASLFCLSLELKTQRPEFRGRFDVRTELFDVSIRPRSAPSPAVAPARRRCRS
jgi:hypothetical protein